MYIYIFLKLKILIRNSRGHKSDKAYKQKRGNLGEINYMVFI